MAQTVTTGVRVVLRGNNTNFSFGGVKFNAADDKLYELAEAVNSLQQNKPVSIVKVVEKAIF